MKTSAWILLAVLAISALLPFIYAYHVWTTVDNATGKDEFLFGVTSAFNTTDENKRLIDKVKNYTNLFIVDSWDVATNETLLTEICDYAASAGLKFIVYFDLISGTTDAPPTYPWHRDWLTTAGEKWGDKFLGIYLHDELGGKQLEERRYFKNASDYSDAANRFVANIEAYTSVQFAKNHSIPLFIADFGLYWWEYLGGYDTVFVELGLLFHNTTQQIAMCRGAANMQRKDWGAIIVAKTNEPPYLGSGQEIYAEMFAAYRAGAKYVVVFNYPQFPETNPYGVLSEEHFEAMENFYEYVNANPRSITGQFEGRFAYVLPKDYGWGARRLDDTIWGLWPADEKSPIIWENMNKLIERHGFELDIIFEDTKFKPWDKYSTVYLWNATIL